MNDKNRRLCTFCLKILYNNEFELIEVTTKQMFDMLLLKLNVDVKMGNVICKECIIKLQNSVAFKSVCLNTEKKILPFINSEEDAELVLKEEAELKNVTIDQKICRFCKRLTEKASYTYLQRENVFIMDMVQKYIPELHLKITEELITCQTCLDSLQSFLNFIMDLLDVEEKIMTMNRTDAHEKLDYNMSVTTIKHEVSFRDVNVAKMEENVLENKFVAVKNEIGENQELEIKQEEIEIKSEDNCSDSFQDTSQICPHESRQKLPLEGRIQAHNYNSGVINDHEMFRYKRKPASSVNSQKLSHRDPLAISIFKCEICSHVTNRKDNLKLHMLTHQMPPDLRMYMCYHCSYVTDQKPGLKQHMITHKSPAETKMYKCDKCQFESKHHSSLERHLVTHRDPSDITIYKCESCPFRSKHESSLIRHVLLHQNPSELKMYKCVTCSYETPQKDRLRRHMLIHQQPSALIMYKCQKCSFETKRRDKLKRHELTHHDLSEVTVYKCEKCLYKTKRRDNLKQHMITHQNSSEPKIYRCESCPYEAKYKRCFEKHVQTH